MCENVLSYFHKIFYYVHIQACTSKIQKLVTHARHANNSPILPKYGDIVAWGSNCIPKQCMTLLGITLIVLICFELLNDIALTKILTKILNLTSF